MGARSLCVTSWQSGRRRRRGERYAVAPPIHAGSSTARNRTVLTTSSGRMGWGSRRSRSTPRALAGSIKRMIHELLGVGRLAPTGMTMLPMTGPPAGTSGRPDFRRDGRHRCRSCTARRSTPRTPTVLRARRARRARRATPGLARRAEHPRSSAMGTHALPASGWTAPCVTSPGEIGQEVDVAARLVLATCDAAEDP